MLSDNQFTALGPAAVGFQTNSASIDRGAEITGNQVGIKGFCGGQVGDGVQGFGAGGFSGVAGFGGGDVNTAGTGVFGLGGVQLGNAPQRGPGIRGIGGGGPNTGTSVGVGVYGQGAPQAPGVVGQAGAPPADGVQGFGTGNFSGVAGFGGDNGGSNDGTGLFGAGGGTSGQGVRGIGAGGPNTSPSNAVGVYGQGGSGADGVQGVSNGPQSAGVHGMSSGSGFAGLFDGNVQVNGDLNVTGTKSAVVPFPDGSHRRLYCMEAPESWLEDFGVDQLVNGQAEIRFDPDFVAVVGSNDYHVFITEYDDNNGLYVTQRTNTGFCVRAKVTTASSVFSFRVVARRKDVVASRFEKVHAANSASNHLPIAVLPPAPARPIITIPGSANS
jgi:hypothetical protein